MTTALPSVHRASLFATGYSAPQGNVSSSWAPGSTDEGDGGSGPGIPLYSAPAYFLSPTASSTAASGLMGQQLLQQQQSSPPPARQQQQQLQQQTSQQLMQLPSTPEGLHRYVRDRVQAASTATRGPLAGTAAFASPAPYSAFLTAPNAAAAAAAAAGATGRPGSGAPRSLTPEQVRRNTVPSDRPDPGAVYGGPGSGGGGGFSTGSSGIFPQASYPSYQSSIGAGMGGLGGRPMSPQGRMITHDAFVSRPTTSNAVERRRLFTGTSQDLLRAAVATPPQTPQLGQQAGVTAASGGGGVSGLFVEGRGAGGGGGGGGSRGHHRGAAQPPWMSMPGTSTSAAASGCGGGVAGMTPPATAVARLGSPGGGGGGDQRINKGRPRGFSGGPQTLARSPPTSSGELDATLTAAASGSYTPYASLPPSASGHRSSSPRLIQLHPGGLGSGAMSVIATGHHMSRQQLLVQYRGVERLLALDMEEVLARAPTPRQVPTLTPGSLDGMGHPVLLAADGARILKRIPDHLPRHTAERMAATPMRPEQLTLALAHGFDPDLDPDALPYSPDGAEGLISSCDEGDYGGPLSRGGVRPGNGGLPYMTVGPEGSIGGKLGARGPGGGGRKAGPGGVGAGTTDGTSPQRITRSWSSPSRQPRGSGGAHARANETLDGSVGGPAAAAAAAAGSGGGLLAESSRSSRLGGDGRNIVGRKQRRDSRSPPPPPPPGSSREATGGRVSPGRGSPVRGSGGGGGRSSSGAGDESGPVVTPKWLGTYIPKEDPLGLWTGKRMSKTEVIVEKRLFAMRHNPGMRLELESRASEALRARAAAQAEMAAVTRAREEEALARKAALRAEIEARKRGWSPRDSSFDRGRSRNPRGLTREAKAALERQLLAEAAAEPRGPLTPAEAAAIIQATWRMYCQRRRYMHIRQMVIRIQRAARLRYCVVRNRRRHAAAAALLLEFLCAIGGNRHAAAAMDLREIHSNYLRRRLLEKKGDLRHQTAVAVLVREWEAVEARILGLRARSLKGSALAAMAVVGFTHSAVTGGGGHHHQHQGGGGGGHHNHHGGHHGGHKGGSGGAGGGTSADKELLTAVAGEAHSAAHGTRLLGKALEARKKGVMLLGGGKDLNKQLTVEYAVAHALATDRVTLSSREPVPSEVKAVVSACYLEHKAIAYTAFIGVVWRRRARWFGMFNQQRHMAMARSVVETGSAWRAMDAIAQEATERLVGVLPVLPRMRTSATLRELRALMQAGVQEADLYTSYMLKGGIHELERRLQSEMLLRQSFGNILRGRDARDVATPPGGGSAIGSGDGSGPGPGGGGTNRRWPTSPNSPLPPGVSPQGHRRVSGSGTAPPNGPTGQSPLGPQSSTTSLNPESPRRPSRTVRIDPGTPVPGGGGGGSGGGAATSPPGAATSALAGPDAFLDTVSEAGSEMTCVSNLSALTGLGAATAGGGVGGAGSPGSSAAANLARARFLSMLPGNKAGLAQLKERWWRDAVVRVDACLRKRYRLNAVSLVASLEDPTAPNLELFASKLAEINSNPEKAEALLAALPGGAVGAAFSSTGAGAPAGTAGGGQKGKRGSVEGAWLHGRAA